MKIYTLAGFLLIFILFLSCTKRGENTNYPNQNRIDEWERIAPFFSPPEKFDNDYSDNRSPLLFYNGDSVVTVEDWQKRRTEILTRWNGMMGNWPEVLTEQKFEFVDTIHRDNFTQHRVKFYWTPDEKTEGYLLIPDKNGVSPAVITLFYEPETAIGIGGKPYRDFAYQLAKRGIVTLSIGTTEATKQKNYSLYYPSIDSVTVQPLSMLAYAAANAFHALTKVENVDSTRIGIMGHSFGGKWAMFSSCLYDKFACAAWSDPGIVFDESRPSVNYWEPWYLGYHPKPWRERGMITESNPASGLYPELVQKGYDLTDLHALMAPRPFLVSGGSEDSPGRWKALNHSIDVNKLLGFDNRVGMTNRPLHDPNEESNEHIYQFFSYFLKSDL